MPFCSPFTVKSFLAEIEIFVFWPKTMEYRVRGLDEIEIPTHPALLFETLTSHRKQLSFRSVLL